uniref:Chorein N-terminal domain-containing protein n=1 Tax=Romanomermis culicivorax TaxID=13658 RepID=A0A915K4N8_ROMCU
MPRSLYAAKIKYAKNLNPDNISVDVLKGKGSLHNVELNEVLLTEILELPAWLSIEFAICNTVALKVPWTSLKTLPIVLFIDEVSFFNTTLQVLGAADILVIFSNMDYTGYGFVNKVLEGMTLNINSLEVKFSSAHFVGSLIVSKIFSFVIYLPISAGYLNQLQIASCTPHWKASTTDLHQTRLKDVSTNEILIFKMLSWQLLRVEASALIDSSSTNNDISAPLRFITSQGRAQITVKKSSLNGAVSAGRIQLILNDLLWVATLSQVRSAISFYHYILTLIQEATNLHKNGPDMSAGKTPVHINDETKFVPAYASLTQPKVHAKSPLFEKFDIVQSSYHFYADCIDLHICDETNTYPDSWNFRSGALQVTLTRLVCDFYPYHLIAGDRKHWVYYNESKGAVWIKKLLLHYFEKFTNEERFYTESMETANIWSNMRSLCCLVRLYDLKVYCVSESSSTDTHNGAKAQLFLGADKDILQLPGEPPPLITLEFNCYYFQSVHGSFPVPPYSTHIEINPIILFVDLRSIRWMSFIYLNLCKTLNLDTGSVEFVPHSDVRIEAVMPRIIFSNQSNSSKKPLVDQDRLIFSTSSCTLTNIEINIADRSRSKNLVDYLKNLRDFDLFKKLFVVKSNSTLKFHQIPQKSDALRLFTGFDYSTNFFVDSSMSSNQMLDVLRKSALNDVWITEMNPIWIDFAGNTVSTSKKNLPFLCDTSLNVWSFMGNKLNENIENADFYLFAKPTSPLKIALTKNQYGFLMRLIDQVNAFTTLLNEDSKCFYQAMQPKSLIMACLCQNLEINLIMLASNGEIPRRYETNQTNSTEIGKDLNVYVSGIPLSYLFKSSKLLKSLWSRELLLPGWFRAETGGNWLGH